MTDNNDFFAEDYVKKLLDSSRDENLDNDTSLRPKTMDEYVGQEKFKKNLSVAIRSAKIRGTTLDHVLLYGPPGLGKTTLPHIIAWEMGANIRVTSGPAIERPADLATILTNLQENDVLFIDEIHRLNRVVEEILYPAMEDFALDFVIGKGVTAQSIRINLPRFTLIGATTRAGLLSSPLRDRFGIIGRLELYNEEELKKIVVRSGGIMGVALEENAAEEIAKRSRGTPRIANRILQRVRDFAIVNGDYKIDKDIACEALSLMEIDEIGLDFTDKTVLETIIKMYNGGPVGIDTLSASVGEEANTIEDVIEPYLLQIGFIARTPKGRVCLPRAYKHLNIPLNQNRKVQLSMFDTFDDTDEN